MTFDIYGGNLRRGYCEVHPDVHEEYPCFVCMSDSDRHRRQKKEEAEYYRAWEAEQYAQMAGNIEYESWEQPK